MDPCSEQENRDNNTSAGIVIGRSELNGQCPDDKTVRQIRSHVKPLGTILTTTPDFHIVAGEYYTGIVRLNPDTNYPVQHPEGMRFVGGQSAQFLKQD